MQTACTCKLHAILPCQGCIWIIHVDIGCDSERHTTLTTRPFARNNAVILHRASNQMTNSAMSPNHLVSHEQLFAHSCVCFEHMKRLDTPTGSHWNCWTFTIPQALACAAQVDVCPAKRNKKSTLSRTCSICTSVRRFPESLYHN